MILKLEFDEQVWSKIIDVLADRPFKETGAIINTMAQQFQDQRNAVERSARMHADAMRAGNGEDPDGGHPSQH